MHESIAKARVAGFRRKALALKHKPTELWNTPACKPAGMVKAVQKRLDATPWIFEMLFSTHTLSRRHQQHRWVVAEPHDVHGWTLTQVKADTKVGSFTNGEMRLRLSDHVLARVLQRTDIKSPAQAFRYIGEGLPAADAIGACDGAEAPVPLPDGSVMYLRKIYEDGDFYWMLTTYLSAEGAKADRHVAASLAMQRATENERRGL